MQKQTIKVEYQLINIIIITIGAMLSWLPYIVPADAYFSETEQILHIPLVKVAEKTFQADLKPIDNNLTHFVVEQVRTINTILQPPTWATYQTDTNIVELPLLNVILGHNKQTFSAQLQYLPNTQPMQFQVMTAKTISPSLSERSSRYLIMPDGVGIALEIFLPPLTQATPVPTLLKATPYWRAWDIRVPIIEDTIVEEAAWWLAQGYALIIMDVRGRGASGGHSPYPFAPAELEDFNQVLNWIARQSWSNGQVGAYGISYDGTAADWMTTLNNPALTAVAPQFSDFDLYADLLMPGGIRFETFLQTWEESIVAQDTNDICAFLGVTDATECETIQPMIGGIKPVDNDLDGTQLAAALADHQANGKVDQMSQHLVARDDLFGSVPFDSLNPYTNQVATEQSGVAYFTWASWFDAGTANGALKRFKHYRNPQQVIIGPWTHGADADANPYRSPTAELELNTEAQFALLAEFFDTWVKQPKPNLETPKLIRYYTLNENVWKTTPTWPPVGVQMQRFYLHEHASLRQQIPVVESPADSYLVDFNATTGANNRWLTQLGTDDVYYGDRREADQLLLTYDSEPLEQPIEITGHPVIKLYFSADLPDIAIYIYLEDVAPDGTVTYLTEGQLRAVHRQVRDDINFAGEGPQHSYLREDMQALTPNEVVTLAITLNPISVWLAAEHRIRIAIAGHDQGTFMRIPKEGVPTFMIYHNSAQPSYIELPIQTSKISSELD
jgi:putative CocE/NonD family hydrolase